MVLAIEPRPMPSPKASSHWKVKEVGTRAGLETHPSDNLAVSGARLVFQEDVIFEQRKIRGGYQEMPRKDGQIWLFEEWS
jgi:hypothetical protein